MTVRNTETVVITGASAGLGRAIAQEFARHGANVVLLARGRRGLEAAAAEVERLGGRALAIPCDVSDFAALDAAATRAEREFGSIDIWINNAMTTVFAPVSQLKPDELNRVTEVTDLGSAYGVMVALARMLPRDRGKIVQVGSALAYRAIPLQATYCGAKHATEGFFESLRSELIHDKSNVTTTMVQMPALNTPQFRWVRNKMGKKSQPVPPIYQPEVGARAVYYAAHGNRREIFVGRSTVWVILLNKFFAALGDRYLASQGYEGQQIDEPVEPNRRDNLFRPLDDKTDYGAHGEFDDRSTYESWQLEANMRRGVLAAAGLGVLGAAGATAALLARR